MRHCYASHLTESKVKWGCPDCEQLLPVCVGIRQYVMLNLALSIVAFFVAGYFIRSWHDGACNSMC